MDKFEIGLIMGGIPWGTMLIPVNIPLAIVGVVVQLVGLVILISTFGE